MAKVIGGLFGGAPDTGALEAQNAKLRSDQQKDKRTLANDKASRRRRRLNSSGALQFAETGAVGVQGKATTLGGVT